MIEDCRIFSGYEYAAEAAKQLSIYHMLSSMLADPLARGQYQCWRRTVTNAGLTLITGLAVIVGFSEYRTEFLLLVTKVNMIRQFISEFPRFC